MSDYANKLLNDIKNEYQKRLDSGKSKEQSVAFDNQLFIDKYHYDENILDDLLTELAKANYIEKWIIPGFSLKVD